ESAQAALRPRCRASRRSSRHSLAIGTKGDTRSSRRRPRSPDHGGEVSGDISVAQPAAVAAPAARRVFTIDNRFLPPILITCILLAAHLSFGVLESYQRTALAIATAIVAELFMGRFTYGKWPHPASAYITGISVGILTRSPFYWPYAFISFISIASKYVLRLDGRHLWNPSNFGLS